jgi:ATP-dependent protease ClpP protease subunit
MKKWFSIQNKADSKEPAEVLIYDQIGKDWFSGDGLAAKEFAEALAEIPKDKKIIVGINSPGGDVWDGLAIYHQLKARGEMVQTRIDGIAASIASVIALAGSKVIMPENALLMIHRAWGLAMGNANDLTKLAAELVKHDEIIAGIYSDKNGKDKAHNLQAMDAETWFNGAEAKAFGFVDELTDAVSISNNHDLSRFKNFAAKVGAPSQSTATQPNTADTNAANNFAGVTVTRQNETKQTKEGTNMSQTATQTAETPTPATVDNATVITAINNLGDTIIKALKPVEAPKAAEPLSPSRIEVGASVLDEYRALKPGPARAAFREERHDALLRQAPQNANTFGSSLVPDSLADAVVTVAHNKLAFLNAFSVDFGTDELRPKATVQVAKATAGATGQSDATNFESGDSTLTNIGVSVSQKSVSFHISNGQYNQGFRLNQIAAINANVLADMISDVVTALMLTGTYGTALTIGAAANFDAADLPPIYGAAKNYNRKNLILDGGHLAYLLPTNKWQFALGEQGAFGFDLIAENNRWTGATANTVGFICDPSAIACASGVPMTSAPAGEFISQSTVSIKNGLTVQINTWFSRSSRTLWASYDVMFGAAAGDTTAAELLITA